MPVVLGISSESNERFKFTLGDETNFVESVSKLEDFLKENLGEQLIVIGPDIELKLATDLAEKFRVTRPSLGILLTRRRLDLSVLNQAIRSGIREVVSFDDSAEILKAAKRSQDLSKKFTLGQADVSSDEKSGKMFLVFSAKGGCGKTTISINLAESLVATSGGTVCLVDFDLQFGDVGIALRVDPTKSISNAVDMNDHLDRQAVSSLVINYKTNFDVLLAPSNPVDAEYITGDLGRAILLKLREMYDYVVIDSSPAFTDIVLESFDLADRHLMITTLDVPTLKNLRVSSSTLDELGFPLSKRIIVVNQSDLNTGLSVQDVERSIGMPVGIQIPSSTAVPMAVNNGVSLFDSEPKHPVSKSIQELTNLLLERLPQVKNRRNWLKRGKSE